MSYRPSSRPGRTRIVLPLVVGILVVLIVLFVLAVPKMRETPVPPTSQTTSPQPGVIPVEGRSKVPQGDEEPLAVEANRLFSQGGQLFFQQGNPQAALEPVRKALTLREKLYPAERYPDGHLVLVQTLNALSILYNALGQHDKMLSHSQRALAMCEKLFPPERYPNGHPDKAQTLLSIGASLTALDQARMGLPYLEGAVAMYEKLHPNGHLALAGALRDLGNCLETLGRAHEALPYHERAVAMCEKLYPEGHPALAQSLHRISATLKAMGQASKALSYQERVVALNERLYPNGHPALAISLNNLGTDLQALGQVSKALSYYERAVALNEKLYPPERFPEGHRSLAASLSNLGAALQALGQASKALPYYRRAVTMNEKLYPPARFPDGHMELALALNTFGGVFSDLGRPREGLPHLQRALAIEEKLYPPERSPTGHLLLETGLCNVGLTLLFMNEAEQALPYAERAVAMSDKLYPPKLFPDGHVQMTKGLNLLGRILVEQGQPGEALACFERALSLHYRLTYRTAQVSSEAETLDFLQSLPPTRDALLSLSVTEPPNDSARWYAALWESKAVVTRIMQQRHEATRIALVKNDKVHQQWQQLQLVRQQLGRLLLDPDRPLAQRDLELRELNDRKEKLERALAGVLPEIERHKELARLGPLELARRLPEGAVFLDFWRYNRPQRGRPDQRCYAVFVIRRQPAVHLIDLGEAQPIDEAIRIWRQGIADNQVSAAPGVLARLVWEKIAPHIPAGTRILYLAPDGDLTRMPFAALPGKQPGSVLLEDYQLAQVPHGLFLLEQRLYPPAFEKKPASFLALGGVRYDVGGSGANEPWPYLPGTDREIRQLEALDPSRTVVTLRGADATTDRLLQELSRAGYAHLATHGFFEEKLLSEERRRLKETLQHWEFRGADPQRQTGLGLRSPLGYTGLVLAGANGLAGRDGERREGILTGESLVELPLDGLRLAVLSACDTGLGEWTEGEGVSGLQRAFHLAGCPNVIASLWQVNDTATAALMTRFYHALWIEKETPLAALRKAQLTIYRHPERIASLAGERGRPEQQKAVQATNEEKGPVSLPVGGVPTRLWAAFVLSGVGD
jgi:CHAT domain-containing protein/tetratricopeptide (TPR) repeat protein